MAIITHRVNIEAWNQNQTPLSLGKSSTLTWYWPSWFSTITRNHRNGNYKSWSQHRDLKPKLNSSKFESIFNFNIMSAILDGIWNTSNWTIWKLNHLQHTKPSHLEHIKWKHRNTPNQTIGNMSNLTIWNTSSWTIWKVNHLEHTKLNHLEHIKLNHLEIEPSMLTLWVIIAIFSISGNGCHPR